MPVGIKKHWLPGWLRIHGRLSWTEQFAAGRGPAFYPRAAAGDGGHRPFYSTERHPISGSGPRHLRADPFSPWHPSSDASPGSASGHHSPWNHPPKGPGKGIQAGANVCMPNLSPTEVREKYALYDNKICTGDEAAQCRNCLSMRMKSIGYQVVVSRGDHLSRRSK